MNIIKFDFNEMVTLQGNQVMTTSLKVAEYFGKRHKDVLKKIRNTINDCDNPEYTQRNFAPFDFIDKNGEAQPAFNLTRNGFMLLVMGFTGKTALQIKIKYMQAFDWMAEQLHSMQNSYLKQHNDLMLEYMKEKDVASMSGRLLRRWGKEKKPELTNRMQKLQEQSQIQLLI
ncbi:MULTISPECIES: Rha family transcriptional regulator [unclassified Gilliamella]|uniref:Rha family transcriptional regulator n=1 Tax=unclassified Gilliamella TaxID=2685620 RepID=UPI001EF00EF3|nr:MULTISPECIES: Rha family transcriptional regulator [unclassified Gilliamella]